MAAFLLPVVFERWGLERAKQIWQRWSGAYVALAATLFVSMLSRNALLAAAAAAVFGVLAWTFRARGERFEPVILGIAAVTLSTMHQSSLGSLFLLMPTLVDPAWWSPVMPVSFFLSSIAAGTGLVVLVEMAIAKAWRRPLALPQLAALGQITFWSLLVYVGFRLGELAVRGQLAGAFGGRLGALFAAEVLVGGVLALVLLGRATWRARQPLLFAGAALAVCGVVLNRVSVVLFAMNPIGPMPRMAPSDYAPSVYEWGISLGLVAATFFLFGLGARMLPLLPKRGAAHAKA